MKQIVLVPGLLALTAATTLFPAMLSPAMAQDGPDRSGDRAFCTIVQGFGRAQNAVIKAEIDRLYAGFSYHVNKRKSVVIDHVESVTFNGCDMRIKLAGAVKRKIRRDAAGSFYVDAVMKNARLDLPNRSGRGCVKDARIDKVRLSNTLRLGEAFYRKVANRFVEHNVCFDMHW